MIFYNLPTLPPFGHFAKKRCNTIKKLQKPKQERQKYSHLFVRPISAVFVSITEPLFQHTHMAVGAALLQGAVWRLTTVLLIRLITAISMTITTDT